MRLRFDFARRSWTIGIIAAALLTSASTSSIASSKDRAQNQNQNQKPAQKKPSISVKANPPVGFSPLRVVVTAELRGGSNDYEDFYCASVEWDWDDDTKSENKADCDPYEPGKSEIKRRYVQEHTFRAATMDLSAQNQGPVQYRVKFLLKQKGKVVGSGQTTVELRSGIGGFTQ